MRKKIDLAGKRFKRLVVVEEAPKNKHGNVMWKCLCDCGSEVIVGSSHLLSGNTKSCGCYEHDLLVKRNTKHGLRHHPAYTVWKDMINRCYSTKNKHYPDYGGRGITVCDEWRKGPKHFVLWAEANGWNKGLQLDRIENNKGYSPENCRFATSSKNLLNTRLIHVKNTSGFRGVSYHKKSKKYRADIQIAKKRYGLGLFSTAKEAAIARDSFIIDRGLQTPLNFPRLAKKED